MKFLALLLLPLPLLAVSSALAQKPLNAAPACGPAGVTFTTQDIPLPSPPVEPQNGKAQVIFMQDDGTGGNHQHYTVVIGMDGAWVGAYKHNAWFAVEVAPGEHHLCAAVQSQSSFGKIVSFAHFTAEPREVYYFRTQFLAGLTSIYPIYPYLMLDRPDSDEANYLIHLSPRSKALPGK